MVRALVRLTAAVVLGVCFIASARAQPMLLEHADSRQLLDSARYHLYGYRMDRAETLLRQLRARPDGRPAAWFHLTSAALHRALMSDEDRHFNLFEARRDSLVVVLETATPSLWRDYMRAESDLWVAIAHLKRSRYLRGALAARSAYAGLTRVVEQDPEFSDANKGLGLLHLGIASMPSSYRFVLRVLGYEGSVQQGLEELRDAYRESRFGREEAGIYLAFTNVMLFLSEEEGLRIIQAFQQADPASTLYGHLYGFMLISNRRTAEAAEVLRAAVRRSEMPEYFYDEYLDFYLAEAHFRNDRFSEAERFYLRYLDRHGGPALKAMAHLNLGLALEMQGRRDEAEVLYRDVQAARTFDTDEAARRMAVRLLAAPMSEIDRKLLLSRNEYDSGRYAEAERRLLALLRTNSGTHEQHAEAAYRLGRIYHAQERFDDAVERYQQAVELRGSELSRWAPWGMFFLGKARAAQGRVVDSEAAYREALRYRGKYDYYQALEQSARANLELLESERVE